MAKTQEVDYSGVTYEVDAGELADAIAKALANNADFIKALCNSPAFIAALTTNAAFCTAIGKKAATVAGPALTQALGR